MRLLRLRAGVVVFLSADGVAVDQRGVSLTLQPGLQGQRFGFAQGGQCAVQIGFERRGVNQEQDIALFDLAAFFIHTLENNAGHPGAHLGHARGHDASAQFVIDRQRGGGDDFGSHLDQGRFLFSVGGLATPREGQCQR